MPPGSKLTTQFIHCRSLPTYLCPVLCLTLRPSRSTSRYTAEGLLHTCPHTHSTTHTRATRYTATVSWAFFYAILSSSSPSSTFPSPLLLSPSILFVSDICFCGFFYYERVSTCPPCCCSCFCSLCCCCCFCCLFSTETLQNCRLMHNLLQL